MKFNYSICLLILLSISMQISQTNAQIVPPKAEKQPQKLEKHGHVRIDDYYWLKEREDTKVIQYLEAENQYTESIMQPTKALQEKLFEELKGRIKQNDQSVPYFENGYWYYTRFEEGKEYPIYCRKKGTLDAKEEIMLNVNELAAGKKFCNAGVIDVSDDNKMIAFRMDTVGRNNFTIHFKDLSTQKILPDAMPNTWGNMVFMADNKTVIYVTKDLTTLRSDKVYRHVLGTEVKNDELIFHEKDETYDLGVGRSKSKEYIFLSTSTTVADEHHYLAAKDVKGTFKIFLARERGHEYSIDHFGDKFYIRTNRNALNFKLMETAINQTEEKNWKEVIPHRADAYLGGFEIFRDFLVVQERIKGLVQIRLINWKTKQEHYVDFGEPTYAAGLAYNPEFNTTQLRYSFTSLVTPSSTYEYDMNTRQKKLLKQQEVLGGYNTNDYVQERLYATAQDGTLVPISIVYKKGLQKNGNNPCLLYAYGSYGSSTDAGFNSNRLSLLQRGFVFAIAHIRGGQEMGRQWYENGKMFNKKNTFTDFIAATEYLQQQKYSSPEYFFAQGGSAGGLLMGAIVNMRPDLYKGVLAAVPFVDVVTTMLDETIPLTTFEYDEWGNPNNIDSYIYMLSYSPYDNVEKKSYPNLLVTTGLHDSQVQYWEPAKWVAKLREMKVDNNILLLKTDMAAGHGGTTGRFKRLKDVAFDYAFMFQLLKITE
ncbi:MAG: S9 family peptidase [Cytophagales bacterium]|nr:MAG: S9 family peptidase [Cytophagales bacterium]